MNGAEPPADPGGIWLDVVAAVDYLAATHRPGLTVWDALDEALRWWVAERLDPSDSFVRPTGCDVPWDDPDPLRTTLERLLVSVSPVEVAAGLSLAEVAGAALNVWVKVMADEFNDGYDFAAAQLRRDARL